MKKQAKSFLILLLLTVLFIPIRLVAALPDVMNDLQYSTGTSDYPERMSGVPDGVQPSSETTVIRSIQNGGLWDDPATWDLARLPSPADSVIISSGSQVRLPGNVLSEAGDLVIEDDAYLRGGDEAQLRIHRNLVNDGYLLEASESFPYFVVRVYGNIVNHGVIGSDENDDGWDLIEIETFADIVNGGAWGGNILAFGNKRRNIDLRGAEASLTVESSEFSLYGDTYFPESVGIPGQNRVVIPATARLFLQDVAYLNIHERTGLVNNGQIIIEEENAGAVRTIRGFGFETSSSNYINTRIITYGNQVPPGFALANSRWFRLEAMDEPGNVVFFDLDITYTPADVGDNMPEHLEVFYSSDGGETWQQISNDNNRNNLVNLYYETGEGRISMTDPPGFGDYVLASANPHAPRPVIGMHITSYDEIRVGGPPHIADLTYYNPGKISIPMGLLEITTSGGAYIERIIPYDENFSFTNSRTMEIEDFAFHRDSTEAMLFTPVLGPGEIRRLRLVLQAVPVDPEPGTDQIAAPPLIVLAGGIAFGMGTGYVEDVFTNGLENFIADPCINAPALRGIVKNSLEQTQQQWNPFGNAETPVWEFAKNAAEELGSETAPRFATALSRLGKIDLINNIGKAILGGAERYEQSTGRSVFQPIECDNEPRSRYPDPTMYNLEWPMTPVFSWDPNRKVGPVGAGAGEFIAEAGRFFYRIDFENLDEATAPAYRVVITDTLSPVFNPESVRLEGESHPGFTFTRNGHILRWEVVGIELPPNVNPPEGEGWVSFSVDAVTGQESGTVFENRASIVFDLNPAIITNYHRNILDNLPPVTVMVPLPEVISADSLTIHFESDDGINGSGVQDVIVFASHDGGPFRQTAVTDTSFVRIPVSEGDWSFYALASDKVGNAEVLMPHVVSTRVVTPTSLSDDEQKPFTWSLGNNFPNPFNPETTIPYSLEQSGEVTFIIYDVIGRRVLRLDAGYREAGLHRQMVSMNQLASGTYLYEMRVTGSGNVLFRDYAKMVLVK